MKKILYVLPLILISFVFAVPSASAAETPPTNECISLFDKLIKNYPKKSGKAQDKYDKEMLKTLYEADCVTSADPKAKGNPFGELCQKKSAAFEEYLDEVYVAIKPKLFVYYKKIKTLSKQQRKIMNRLRRATNKYKNAKIAGKYAKAKRIRKTMRALERANRLNEKREEALGKSVIQIVKPYASAIYLSTTDAITAGCLEGDAILDKSKSPFDKVIMKRRTIILLAVFSFVV